MNYFSTPIRLEVPLSVDEVVRRLQAVVPKSWFFMSGFSGKYPFYGKVTAGGCRLTFAVGRNAIGRVLDLRFSATDTGSVLTGEWRPRWRIYFVPVWLIVWLVIFLSDARTSFAGRPLLALWVLPIALILLGVYRLVMQLSAQHEEQLLNDLQAILATAPAPSDRDGLQAGGPAAKAIFLRPRKSLDR